ncbi:hypothetical protein [Pseudoalteromonas phage XCL1123]|nr:hypothetical protein [Pseudoalteromonas phage XCL1123]
MWGKVDDNRLYLDKAIEFTGDHKLYGSFMMKVVNDWPYSCENALTDYHMNRRAWIGHAACALAIRCPENTTRQAWKDLSYEQQYLANKEASRAIRAWENMYIESGKLRESMGGTLL